MSFFAGSIESEHKTPVSLTGDRDRYWGWAPRAGFPRLQVIETPIIVCRNKASCALATLPRLAIEFASKMWSQLRMAPYALAEAIAFRRMLCVVF